MTLGCLDGVSFVLGLLVWFVVLGFFFQILTKTVTLVKLSKPQGLTQEIYNKLANGEPHVLSTTRGGA